MKKEDVIKSCYSVLGRLTPLELDCGKLCGGKCCGGDENTGMILFPGEEKLIDPNMIIKVAGDGTKVAICDGTCDRRRRPLSCRIYPLFPVIREENGQYNIDVDFDIRSDCPLTAGELKMSRRFCKAVKRVGKYLLLNEETAEVYKGLSDEINDYYELENIFLKK